MKHALTLAALILGAACNGDGNGVVATPPTAAAVNERLDRADTMRDRITGFAGTSWDAMPDTGQAEFSGMGRATIDRTGGGKGDDINLVGYVVLTADFEELEVSGEMMNIQGYTGRNARNSNVFDADGRIQIGNKSSEIETGISNSGLTNRWNANYRGTVDTPEGDIDLRGDLAGRFRGTAIRDGGADVSIKSIFGSDTDTQATVDGDAVNGATFEVFGLNN